MSETRVMCGTGHRPEKLGGYGQAAYDVLVNVAVIALTEHQPDLLISGMALGWDQALAEAAVWLDIPFVAALPTLHQDAKWFPESKKQWAYLCFKAVAREVITAGPYTPDCLQLRNEWMIDHTNAGILALHDGTPGGTANCLNYNRRLVGQTVYNYYDLWKDLRAV